MTIIAICDFYSRNEFAASQGYLAATVLKIELLHIVDMPIFRDISYDAVI
jgi:hypothetical protein